MVRQVMTIFIADPDEIHTSLLYYITFKLAIIAISHAMTLDENNMDFRVTLDIMHAT